MLGTSSGRNIVCGLQPATHLSNLKKENYKMIKFRFTLNALAIAIFAITFAATAQAQATRTWVSGVGDDANPCSRTAPCKTFAGSISKTATGGYINCLDPGGFGAVTITKAITIQCDEEIGHILASGGSAIIVNTPAGAVVTLRGLSLEGIGGLGTNGISYVGPPGILNVEEVVIHDFSQNGINFAPNGSGLAQLNVSDEVLIHNNTNGNISFSGIQIKTAGGASANVSISGVQLWNNANGVFVDGTGGGGGVLVNVRDCNITNGSVGIGASTNNSPVASIVIDRTTVSYSGVVGVVSNGGGATIRIGNSTISHNVAGVNIMGGSTMQSFKNNQFASNLSDGPLPLAAVTPNGGGQ